MCICNLSFNACLCGQRLRLAEKVHAELQALAFAGERFPHAQRAPALQAPCTALHTALLCCTCSLVRLLASLTMAEVSSCCISITDTLT